MRNWEIQSIFYSLRLGPGSSDGKETAHNAGNLGLIPRAGMATHSIILTCKIPWTEDTRGLQSTGSQKVGHG